MSFEVWAESNVVVVVQAAVSARSCIDIQWTREKVLRCDYLEEMWFALDKRSKIITENATRNDDDDCSCNYAIVL